MACKCGSEYIVNKKYKLCATCNFERLHGQPQFYVKLAKAQDSTKSERTSVKTKKKRVNHSISDRTKERRKDQVARDRETYLVVFFSRESVCEECGTPLPDEFSDENGNINCIGQYSHILSKGSHPEFRNDARNFNRLCPNPCHDRWEFHDKENMKIYAKNQLIIQQLYDERNG